MEPWKDQLRSRITKPETLATRLSLTAAEIAYFERAGRAVSDRTASDSAASDRGAAAGIGPDNAGSVPEPAARTDVDEGPGVSGPRPPRAPLLPLAVTEYYLSLSDGTPGCPIRRQAVPRAEELAVRDYELSDPLGEGLYTAVLGTGPGAERIPRLVHRYADRALLLVTDRCAVYCRHCFRRTFTGTGKGGACGTGEGADGVCPGRPDGTAGTVGSREIEAAAAYAAEHPEIREILLSGGDPLTLDDDKLFSVMEGIARKRTDILFRLCTRMPVVLPSRVTPGLVGGLRKFLPVWVVTHFNHPREITPESSEALRMFVDGGIPVANQTVLLRGVNDDPATLYGLNSLLLFRRVKPLYLFQGDLAAGTSHLRVPLSRGLRIFSDLRARSSGLALPRYAVDLPGGGGKVSLEGVVPEDAKPEGAVEGKPAAAGNDAASGTAGWYTFRSMDGQFYRYPEELEDIK